MKFDEILLMMNPKFRDQKTVDHILPKLLTVAKAAKMILGGMEDENYYLLGWEVLDSALKKLEEE